MILPLIRIPHDPQAAAAWWAARRRLGLVRTSEDQLFAKWLKKPENAAAWARTEKTLEDISAFAAMPEIRTMRDAALATAPAAPRPGRGAAHASAIAAAAALLVIAVPTGVSVLSDDRAVAPAVVRHIATAVGEQREVELADGSRVTLNTASTIAVAYTRERREIRLLRGQALFRVAKDTRRPFVVTAGDRLVTAHGTTFDVEFQGDGDVRVFLVEGNVTVEPVIRSGLARMLPVLERQSLEPGQQLTTLPDGAARVEAASVSSATSWTSGQLVFRDDRIADAVAEFNRYSSETIVIPDPAIGNLRISGVFRTHRQANFLAALMSFYPLEARSRGSGVITLEWRDPETRATPP